MTRRIFSGASQYVASNTTKTLHTGPGKILAVLYSSNQAAGGTLTLYDNTAGSGTVLAVFITALGSPIQRIYPIGACPVFTVGLTAVTQTNSWAHIITEAQA